MSGAVSQALGEESDVEDLINQAIEQRKMLKNASYFAFTATPKNKTLEVFGEPWPQGGKVRHRPFHSYTMKQAIQEGFILDVVQNYTPVNSYYRLIKTVEDDPEFDVGDIAVTDSEPQIHAHMIVGRQDDTAHGGHS